MIITLVDTKTGQRVTADERLITDAFQWEENNWSCDCNRACYFGIDLPDTGFCAGAKRFLVVASDHPEFDFRRWNDEYPEDLRKKFAPV